MSFSFHHLFAVGRRPFEQSKWCSCRVGDDCHEPPVPVGVWRDQYLAAKGDSFGNGIGSAHYSYEIEPMGMALCSSWRKRIQTDSCVIVVRQQNMLQSIITRKIKYFIAEYGLIEGGSLIGIGSNQRTPDPFAGVG